MINRIGSSYTNYLNYQNTISKIRLQQALEKNPNYQKGHERPVESTQTDKYKEQYKKSSLDFLQSYSSTMSDVMQSANSLRTGNSTGVANRLAVTSSDPEVAKVTNRYPLRQAKDLALDVTQLAAAQQNRSDGVKGTDKAQKDMAFSISGAHGRFDINVSAMKDDGTAKSNTEMLREAATAINKTQSGVTATVKNDDGKYYLNLASRATGTDSAFEISGELGAAEGLQNAAVEAADAKYSVTTDDGVTKDYTSQSNSVQLDLGRLNAELKEIGTTNVTVGQDADKVISAVSDLLNNYNKAVSFLEDNESHGRGVANQLKNFERSIAPERTLERLGISVDKDGQFVLDKEALKKSLQEEPSLTRDLLSGNNGLAQRLYNRSASAMNSNSASLISNDLQEMNYSIATDPLHFMNMYSKNGTHNMQNYVALGLMMNYLV